MGATVVITNGPHGSWREGGGWTVREVMRLGAPHEPAEETFGTLVRGALGPDGNLYVLDPQAATIKVFDGGGKLVREFGREGEGPGELSAPTAMTWDMLGRLWVANAFNGRYTLYDSIGGFIRTVPRPIRGYPGRHQLIFDRRESLVDMGSRSSGTSPVPLFRIDTAGSIIDSLAPIELPSHPFAAAPLPPGFDREALLYLPRTFFAVTEGGNVWSVGSDGRVLVRTSAAGDTLRIVYSSHREALSFDRGTRTQVERELGKLQAVAPYELVRPVVSGIDVLPDGHVVVEITEEVGRPSDVYDIYDPEGRYLGALLLGVGIVSGVTSFRGDTMIVVTRDDLDVPYVVRLHLSR